MRFKPGPCAALIIGCLLAHAGRGAVRLPQIFSAHAVLQRDQPIRVWGWAEPGEKVTVSLHGRAQSATAGRLGTWLANLAPEPAGGPFELTVAGSNTIVLQDILIGDVWFASGQSNMEMPLKGFGSAAPVKNGDEEIRHATNPSLRLFMVPKKTSAYPLRDVAQNAGWKTCSPESAAGFSAVAYFFGREIAAKEHVPVGLIDSTWGGTPAEAWVSGDTLSADAGFMPVFATWARIADQQDDIPALLRAERKETEEAAAKNAPPPKHPWHPDPASWSPSWLFNGMVAPFTEFGIRGVIWYQGETNSKLDRAPMYYKVFSGLIRDWRRQWHEGDFPFLFAQISSFRSDESESWAMVRDAQRRTLELANTAMAVTIDVGNPDNVHPADKQTVGARLALAARALAYHETVEFSGPLFREAAAEPGCMRLWFDHADGGLSAKGTTPEGFEVAGEDHRFLPATARIEGSAVVVTNPTLAEPKYVRYGWENAPVLDLYNKAGLPASPFTSE